jgi:hypothetical protein
MASALTAVGEGSPLSWHRVESQLLVNNKSGQKSMSEASSAKQFPVGCISTASPVEHSGSLLANNMSGMNRMSEALSSQSSNVPPIVASKWGPVGTDAMTGGHSKSQVGSPGVAASVGGACLVSTIVVGALVRI